MKLLIENEGDMELGVKYATSLALKQEKNLLTYHFPSSDMMSIFVTNLVTSYVKNSVPEEPNLFIELVCPEDEDDGECENDRRI
tara:strand:- start:1843 stop:2094 length:252 start_codon:yes stop_codon:yes gene_type:complete